MSWQDSPTDNQLNAIYRFIEWHGHNRKEKAEAAVDYLRTHATRRQASDELGRLRDLYCDKKLTKERCFESEIWQGFEFNGDDYPTTEQISLIYAIFRRHMPIGRAALASNWLDHNATKQEVSDEIDRVKELEKKYALDEEACFISNIWKKYKPQKVGLA